MAATHTCSGHGEAAGRGHSGPQKLYNPGGTSCRPGAMCDVPGASLERLHRGLIVVAATEDRKRHLPLTASPTGAGGRAWTARSSPKPFVVET